MVEIITRRDLSMEINIEKMGLTKRSCDLLLGRFFHVFFSVGGIFQRASSKNERGVALKGVFTLVGITWGGAVA